MTKEPQPPEPQEQIKQDRSLALAHRIMKGEAGGLYLYCLEDDKYYFYTKGYWKSMFDIEFLGNVCDHMKEITKRPIRARREIAENFKYVARQKLETFNWSEMLNLENSMINPYDGVPNDHHPSFYSTLRLPYQYDENAKCPLWEKTLLEIFENDIIKINMLQEFFGYCLTRETKHHKALLLLGESRSGKSTILQTMRAMLGNNNCSSVPLKYISNPQYTAMLISKLVNIDTDVSARAEQYEAEFKTITSGEPVAVNQKYVAAFDFTPYCKIVMAANIFPRITDHSSAFYNRLILIPCDRVFTPEEQDRDLPKKLLKELPGILNWSIEGLKRLTRRGMFESCNFMKEALDELEKENNPCNIFFDDKIEINPNSYIEKSELYKNYKDWCILNGHHIITHVQFSRNLLKRFEKITTKQARAHTIKRPYIWPGLEYIENKAMQPIKQDVIWSDEKP